MYWLNLCIFNFKIMIYIFETEILNNKPLIFSLQKIYGLGKKNSSLICKQLGFSNNLQTSKLSNDQISKLIKAIEKSDLIITNELRKLQAFSLRNLIDIKSYKGLRRLNGLPVRGQRTHTNSRTSRRQKRF
jgi:small subunit ribosomal protein S13